MWFKSIQCSLESPVGRSDQTLGNSRPGGKTVNMSTPIQSFPTITSFTKGCGQSSYSSYGYVVITTVG